MKRNLALAVIGLSLIASSGAAITLEDVAGIYIGKVTRTSFDLVEHLDQVTAIYPGGDLVVYNYIKDRGQPRVLFLEYWRMAPLSQFGTFGDLSTDAYEGLVRLRGNHLTLVIEFADGFTTRELQGRRVDAFPDFITPWTP